MKIAPKPRPTAPIMKAKPIVTPAMCGSVGRKPCVSPDESSITLFGPGVKNMTVANTTNANRSDCDMTASRDLWQDLRPFREQHDRYSAHDDEHAREPQWPEPLPEHDTGGGGADERHQQRKRNHLGSGVVPEQPSP